VVLALLYITVDSLLEIQINDCFESLNQ